MVKGASICFANAPFEVNDADLFKINAVSRLEINR